MPFISLHRPILRKKHLRRGEKTALSRVLKSNIQYIYIPSAISKPKQKTIILHFPPPPLQSINQQHLAKQQKKMVISAGGPTSRDIQSIKLKSPQDQHHHQRREIKNNHDAKKKKRRRKDEKKKTKKRTKIEISKIAPIHSLSPSLFLSWSNTDTKGCGPRLQPSRL